MKAVSNARWLVTGSWNPVSRPSTERTLRSGFTKSRVKPVRGRGGHLGTPGYPGEQGLIRVHGPGVGVAVVDRPPMLRDHRFERPVGQGEPQPRDARVRRKESCRRRSDPEFLARLDRKRAWLPCTPARLRNPEV